MLSRTFKRCLTALDNIFHLPNWLGITISIICGACAIKYMHDQQQLIHTSTDLTQWMAKNEFIALCEIQMVEPSQSSLYRREPLHSPIIEPCKVAMRKPVPPYTFINLNGTSVALEKESAFTNGKISPWIVSTWRATQAALKDHIPWQNVVLIWCSVCIVLNRRLVDRFIRFCMPARKNNDITYSHNVRRQKPMREQVPKRWQRTASRIALFALLCFILAIWKSLRIPTNDNKCELFCEQTSASSDMKGFWEAAVPDPKVVEACWYTRCLTNLARRSVHAHEPVRLWGPYLSAFVGNRSLGWVKPWGPL